MARGRVHVPRLALVVGAAVAVSAATMSVATMSVARTTAAGTTAVSPTGSPGSTTVAAVDPVTALGSGMTLVAGPGGWRVATEPISPVPRRAPDPALLATLGVTVIDAVLGDVDRDGDDEVVVVFTRPARPTLAGATLATPVPTDARGRDLHLGVYDAALHQQWVAGTVLSPISAIAVCDGVIVLAHSSAVGASDRVGVGVIRWSGYGFTTSPDLPDLPGDGVPACADSGHHHLDPVVLARTVP